MKPCPDGMCMRTDGVVCPDDQCDRWSGTYVQSYVAVLKSRPGYDDGYELGIEFTEPQADAFRKFLSQGGCWFEYTTPFGEPRMVNTNRFDLVDFKPSKRNAAKT